MSGVQMGFLMMYIVFVFKVINKLCITVIVKSGCKIGCMPHFMSCQGLSFSLGID